MHQDTGLEVIFFHPNIICPRTGGKKGRETNWHFNYLGSNNWGCTTLELNPEPPVSKQGDMTIGISPNSLLVK